MTTPTPSSPLLCTTLRLGTSFGVALAALSGMRLLGIYISPLFFLLYLALLVYIPIVAFRAARAYRDQNHPTGPYPFMLSFSFVVLLHVFGAIVALIPQYFYFRDVAPMLLEPMLTQMRSMKGIGSPAEVEQIIESIRGISLLQWLWTDYCFTIFLGAIWGTITGLILKRN